MTAREEMLRHLRESATATAPIVRFTYDGPLLAEWVATITGPFGKLVEIRAHHDGEKTKARALVRTMTDWEKWVDVPENVHFNLTEFSEIRWEEKPNGSTAVEVG